MSAPDFAAIIASVIGHGRVQYLDRMDASATLATYVPELCQACGGEQFTEWEGVAAVACPDCPTVGQLLAIGAAVWTAPDANPNHAPVNHRGTDHHVWASGWDAALVHLRAVQS